jgi:hypothetical protein
MDVVNKKCEDCQLKQPSFGLPADRKKRWCGVCAKGHAGVVNVVMRMCEDCGLKCPSVGLVVERKVRWCSGCAKGHAGTESNVSHRKVRKTPSWPRSWANSSLL